MRASAEAGSAPIVPLTGTQKEALDRLRAREPEFVHHPCLCGGAQDVPIASHDRYGLPVRTVLCTQCGLMRSDPCLTDAELERFYAEDYRAIYRSDNRQETLFLEQELRGARILAWLAKRGVRGPGRMLEIGAASGGTMQQFERAGWRTAGCDPDPLAVAHGRRGGLDLEVGDVTVLRSRGPAKLLVLSHVLEHLRDPVAALRNVVELLEPGGCIYAEVPGIHAIRRTYGCVATYLHIAHVWHFTARTLEAVGRRAGLECVECDERVRALFRPTAVVSAPGTDPVAYEDVARRLRQVERWRHWPRLSRIPAVLSGVTRSVLGEALHTRLRRRYWMGRSS